MQRLQHIKTTMVQSKIHTRYKSNIMPVVKEVA